MSVLKTIKDFYKPLQPTVRSGDPKVSYQEVKPQKEIAAFVYCFWQLKTPESLKHPFIYRVVSDGCIDIFFDHNKPADSFVMGFCKRYTEFPIGTSFDYIGIRFLPSAFPLLFDVNAKTLSDQSQELSLVLAKFSEWVEKNTGGEVSFITITDLLNNKLNEIIQSKNLEPDLRFYNSLQLIFENKGKIDIERELSTGLSARQLRRVFNFFIGTTPKKFSNVVRFQHILNARDLSKNKSYLDVGFYDQAHFIKNFKTFYGVTPSKALG